MSSSSFPSPPPSPDSVPLPFTSSFCLTGCPELDLSVTLSPTPKTSHSQLKPHPQGQTRERVRFEEPVVVKVTPEPHLRMSRDAPLQQPIRGQRKSRGFHYVGGATKQAVEPPVVASNQDVGRLERVELNTTLALKAELQSLQGAEFNPQKAVQETLQRSERTKNLINSRATEVVNVSRSQLLFTSLVSVEVQKDQLISRMLQDRRLPTESPSTREELVNYKPKPLPRPNLSNFDLYRRQI
ncbi:hypothetical protein INR49_028295, partial [Caranx melampygus]